MFNMMAGTQGMEALRTGLEGSRSFINLRQIPLSEYIQDQDALMVYRLSWFTVIACSFVFFLCFATSEWAPPAPPLLPSLPLCDPAIKSEMSTPSTDNAQVRKPSDSTVVYWPGSSLAYRSIATPLMTGSS